MGKTFSIKVLFGIYLLLMAGKVFAFSCNVDGGSSIGAGTTSVYVNLDPVIQPGQNLVVDLSQHISCWNDYGGWYDTDHINLVQGSAFAGSLQSYKGSLYWNNVTYPFPLTTNTNVLDIGDKTPMPLPLKLYITPVGAAGGRVNLIALTPDGKRSSRRMDRLKVVIYPMADRSLVTYFPESNHMLTLDNHDPLSGIPGYKSIPVELEPSN
ncbi:fimbrial protein [Escherichia coli]|uniref:fimbrial protein n=1 Tax=Escherichia coli TaxID=562 RepID=UPI002E1526E1